MNEANESSEAESHLLKRMYSETHSVIPVL